MDAGNAGEGRAKPNRLIDQASPYLLQHAHNPVDWYPWGEEALARSRAEDKPIFLSIGYSTCHWCHAMAHESFERRDVAGILNRHFVTVKVDREERPDLDATYMLATQLMTGTGGWPNSVWLLPDGRPWYAGTYFPREDRGGQAGFKTILRALAGAWQNCRDEVDRQAGRIWSAMQGVAAGTGGLAPEAVSGDLVHEAVGALDREFDAVHGGFGPAPKFPPHAALELLLHELGRRPDDRLRGMLVGTLDAMSAGGIRDHLGGGFHRYSTDARWFAPHFEKTLYDNAQLARAYAEAWKVTGQAGYRQVAAETLDWMLREMSGPEGAFRSALDADSEGREGRFYVWRQAEVLETLGAEGGVFCRAYGVEPEGNWREEPGDGPSGANILHLPRSIEVLAAAEGLPAAQLEERLAPARGCLLAARQLRPRPGRDDKILAAWNGLAIGALARAGVLLAEPRHLGAAERAAGFVLANLRRNGGLLRLPPAAGAPPLPGFLDDHAFLAAGLLDLHEATGAPRWRDEARGLADAILERFPAESGGFYFTAADCPGPGLRIRDSFDQAVPSANAAAAQLLVRFGAATGDGRYREAARRTLEAFAPVMRRAPAGT
jgi:hypothetical protein